MYFILGLLVGILLAIIIMLVIANKHKEDSQHETRSERLMRLFPVPKKTLIKERHMSPKYYGYNGGYCRVNQCNSCNIIGMSEDMHIVNPCKNCGGKVIVLGAAIWEEKNGEKQWCFPEETPE